MFPLTFFFLKINFFHDFFNYIYIYIYNISLKILESMFLGFNIKIIQSKDWSIVSLILPN